ncbi:hypothetical protein [Nitrincola sp. MINF-07-Sa-05]|uniref:hypothetical protein n=1 Tax=Nitrincola salilacus TaxID=3400273 RepID=UPI003917CA94
MYLYRGLLLLILATLVILPALVDYWLYLPGSWLRPFIIWLAIIAVTAFITTIVRRRHT